MSQRNAILNYLSHLFSAVNTNRSSATAVLANTSVDSIDVSFSGMFYNGARVSIDSPGIVTANAIANVVGGSVDSVTIDIPGGVYAEFIHILTELGFVLTTQSGEAISTEQPYVPAVSFSGGGGSGANAYAVANSDGAITSIVIDDGGSGYSSPPSVIIEPPSDPIPAANAVATVRRGRIEAIVVTNGSHSYTAVPNVIISASTLQFNSNVSQTYRSYRYLEDINDFPTICMGGTPSVDYLHYGAGQRLQTMQQFIRGYVYSSEEDSLRDSEALARDIEAVVDSFEYLASNLGVQTARVTQISTDEGLLSPYGVCDVQVEIAYEQTN